MPLPPPTVARTLVHTRRVRFEGYKRADGLWDIEAHLTDIKPTDYRLASGVRPAGLPVHDMWIRLTVDRDLRVVDALAITDAMPYPPYCSAVNPDYHQLIGLQLARGFRKAVHDRFHDVAGCTHINELLAQFPSAAVQIMAGDKVDNADEGGRKPFQLDRCMALDTAGEGVRQFYPRWYRSTEEEVG